jgi:hypothetical protein
MWAFLFSVGMKHGISQASHCAGQKGERQYESHYDFSPHVADRVKILVNPPGRDPPKAAEVLTRAGLPAFVDKLPDRPPY